MLTQLATWTILTTLIILALNYADVIMDCLENVLPVVIKLTLTIGVITLCIMFPLQVISITAVLILLALI